MSEIKYAAEYVPMQAPGAVNPSLRGFSSEKEAKDYAYSQWCYFCKEEFIQDDPNPGCWWEWDIFAYEDGEQELESQ